MNKKVLFTAMEHGTQEDYDIVTAHELADIAQQPDRVLGWLRQMDGDSPYQISRLHHCLQTATRAENDGADDETVVCALLHDIGNILAPANHSQVAAALIEPYVSDKNYWIVKHHGIFQAYYYAHHRGGDRNARDRYHDHPCYQATVDFCHKWDQTSFDPDYDSMTLEEFEPMVRRIFARPPFQYDRK